MVSAMNDSLFLHHVSPICTFWQGGFFMKALRKGTLAACAALILLLCGTVSLFSQNTATAGDWDAYASIVEEINGKYGTEITLHNIPQTRTPEEFKAWLTKLAEADAVLLIASALTPQACRTLTCQAHELNLEVLLELHGEHELEYLTTGPDVVGINNRNLGTFHTDVTHSLKLAEHLPKHLPRISESGITHPETLKQLRQAGFNGFLIGETFMKTEAPGETLRNFIQTLGI